MTNLVPAHFLGRCCLGLAIFLLLFTSRADAHQAFDTETNIRLLPNRVTLKITLTNAITASLLTVNPDEEIVIDASNLASLKPRLEELAGHLYEVRTAGKVQLPTNRQMTIGHNGDLIFLVAYPPPGAGSLRFRALFVQKISPDCTGSLAALDEIGNPLGTKILLRNDDIFEIAPALVPALVPSPTPIPAPPPASSFWKYLKSGLGSMLLGFDHWLFLVGLLIACRSFRSMLAVIAFFALGYSLTLALATFHLAVISQSLIGPLIAVSVIFVGLENLLRARATKWRAWVAFGFGLIHGFGFAETLQQTGFSASGVGGIIPLLSFNLGIVWGLIAAAVILQPLFLQIHKSPRLGRLVLPVLSGAVTLAGAWLLLQRAFLS